MRPLYTRAVMALCMLATIGGRCFANDKAITVEMARAHAEASVAIAKASMAQPCQTQECKLAEVKAEEQIVLAKLGKRLGKVAASCQCSNGACANCDCPPGACSTVAIAPAPVPVKATVSTKKTAGHTFSADGRTLTYDDGKVFTLRTDGTFWPAGATATISTTAPASRCYTIDGKTVCPLNR